MTPQERDLCVALDRFFEGWPESLEEMAQAAERAAAKRPCNAMAAQRAQEVRRAADELQEEAA